MVEPVRACTRCGSRTELITTSLVVVDGPIKEAFPELNLCNWCTESLTRWMDRKKRHHRGLLRGPVAIEAFGGIAAERGRAEADRSSRRHAHGSNGRRAPGRIRRAASALLRGISFSQAEAHPQAPTISHSHSAHPSGVFVRVPVRDGGGADVRPAPDAEDGPGRAPFPRLNGSNASPASLDFRRFCSAQEPVSG